MSILLATTLSAWLIHSSSHLDTPVYCVDEGHAIRTHAGEVITNSFHNCLETHWSSSMAMADAIAPCHEEPKAAAAQSPAPVAPTSAVLNQEMLNVYFAFNSADITPAAKEKLDKTLELLRNDAGIVAVDIVGYADHLGNVAYNDALSQRRAEAVRQYLESQGYLKTRNIAVVALGAHQSVSDCSHLAVADAKDCLWRDRRVEIKVNRAQ
ncbi:MAG: OmpA family protein [Alphaproteobacteria bacterium]|nr:MAG: OmpA family protein [Alphaproteobacteria bacterium]TAF76942.1 MAG: OmpA family protein [Alphaproteobacteria bacterium]